jgi:hypothetical protein
VLQTTFVTAHGTVRVTDAITLDNGGFLPWFELVRGIEGVSGTVPMRFRITPRFGAGEKPEETTTERLGEAVLAMSRLAVLALHPFDAGQRGRRPAPARLLRRSVRDGRAVCS